MPDQQITGILIANLGTPAAPTTRALRRYLAQFLGDPRVIEYPRWWWLPLLHGIILNTRPRRSARLYQRVWREDGSPLLTASRRQVAALHSDLKQRAEVTVMLSLGMRYGEPSIPSALGELRAAGATRLIVLSLNPQYSATTVGSIVDAVTDELRAWRYIPELCIFTDYHDNPPYIEALAASVRESWSRHGQSQKLLMTFHGIPKAYVDKGDPYRQHCLQTARLLSAALNLTPEQWMVTFQSRFGPSEWLQPYTDRTLKVLPGEGVKSVDVICPGFASDCLETLEEIAIEGRRTFLQAGGQTFNYIPALNDRPDHIQALSDLLIAKLS